MKPEITFCHVHAEHIGYARLGVKLAQGLKDAGVEVYDDLGEPPPARERENARRVRAGHRVADHPTNVAAWVSVPGHASWWWEGQHTSMFTMWEATRLPEQFRETMHEFDTLVVPSMQNVELFGQYHDNVRYCPLGVDPDDWHYTPRTEPGPFFRFLIGGTGARKGTDLAYRAFRAVFPNWQTMDPVPQLVMKNPKGESGATVNINGTDTYLSFRSPGVEMVSGRLTGAEEIALYESAHVYLQPSRGEGFGLQPLQAIAQGLPTILTNAHGHAGYAHLGIGLPWKLKQSEYFIYGDAGEWWEPDFDALCDAMHDTYHNYEHHEAKAKMAARVVARDWTWSQTTSAYIAAHDGLLDVPFSGDGSYHLPEPKRYPVIVDRDYTAQIADGTYIWRKGKTYWESADIKRILFEAEVLDPACLTKFGKTDDIQLDVGLDLGQVERLPEYTGAKEYCPTCHQRVNTVPTKTDDILAEMEAAAGA